MSAFAAMSDAVNALIMAFATVCLTFGSARTAIYACIREHFIWYVVEIKQHIH